MSQGNPNPKNLFTSDNQPDSRGNNRKSLSKALKAALVDDPSGADSLTQDIIAIARQEIKACKEGTRPLTAQVMRLIELLWDRSEGPVKQDTDVNLSGAIVVMPAAADMDAKLAAFEQKVIGDGTEGDEDDE